MSCRIASPLFFLHVLMTWLVTILLPQRYLATGNTTEFCSLQQQLKTWYLCFKKTELTLQELESAGTFPTMCGNNSSSQESTQRNFSHCSTDTFMKENQHVMRELMTVLQALPFSPYDDPTVEETFNECIGTVLSQENPTDGRLYCRRTFDGWGCWNDTPAGKTAYTRCPRFVPGFLPQRHAHKVCTEDGTWFRHPETNKTWSNYTTCVDYEDLTFRQLVNSLYISGYSISVVALTLSLVIFCYFRSLQCTRTTIHKNFFLSFVVNNIMWIIWYTVVIENPNILMRNEPTCQVLHIFVQYSLVCNYFWMFCEGLYLHTILVVAFVSEDNVMRWFYLIGWGVPLPLTAVYAVLRGFSSKSLLFCWIEESVYLWVLSGPVCVSMLLNLIFLINIIRVLVTKMRAVNSPDTNQTKKAVRATVILIPLLGLHYLLTPFRPEPKSVGEKVYEVASAIVTSLQGFCVALLFCFCNGEVTSVLTRKWRQKRAVRETGKMPYAATTISFLQKSPSDTRNQWPEEPPEVLSHF